MGLSDVNTATLRYLYGQSKENPNTQRAKLIGQVMPDSGYAKPFLAYAMGKEMASAGDWDANREQELKEIQSASASQTADTAAQEYAQKVFTNIIKVSEKDPVAATQMLKVESENGNNPYLKKFQGITFNAPTKDGWATVAASDGFVYFTYLPKLQEAAEAGPDSDIYKKTVIKIGEGKPQKSTIVPEGGVVLGEDGKPIYKNPKTFKPESSGDKPRKVSEIVKDIRTTASQIASKIGDTNLTEAILQSSIKDPKVLAAMKDKKDPYIAELNDVLQSYKDEYTARTGKPWGGGTSAPVDRTISTQNNSLTGTLSKDGKTLSANGKKYPVNNGIVVIEGKKYKVGK